MIEPPLSLYIHLPWCVKKCPYCDFNSHSAGDNTPKDRYILALLHDIERQAYRGDGRDIQTVFLGGGTPSLFTPNEIGQLLDGVKQCFSIAQNAEVTMEENPGTVERGSPVGYLDAGITRLSIGAQSFDDGALKLLGRIHSSADTLRAVLDAKEAGFDNINIDLMYGLPSQSVEMAMADLTAAIDLDVTHISWYQLTLEPNTIFYAHPPPNLPDDDLAFEIQEQGQELLRRFGYEQYEVSAYAREGRLCQHNLNYWSFGDYLAVGAGAHGKITVDSKICRYQKPANPMQYMIAQESNEPEEDLKPLSETDLMFEFMLNALRLNAGFTEKLFVARTGLMTTDLVDATVDVRKKGLIEYNDDQIWMPTKLGRRFLNDLQSSFITN